MTISGWIGCIFLAGVAIVGGFILWTVTEKRVLSIIATLLVIALIFVIGFWYYGNTASGIRARTDERAELQNGLNRVITIYTADGNVLKQYEGKIDVEQDQDYIKFDWNGKRYIYYNCYVETIADIP